MKVALPQFRWKISLYVLFPVTMFISCIGTKSIKAPVQIAFIADAHLLDVHGKLEDIDYAGLKSKNGNPVIIRTMGAQLYSTRLFNENYFAFITALDGIVKRNIKYVALPGDFSDDGQPLNIRGINKILNRYSKDHGIHFFTITGNHDPTSPFGDVGGKRDFLGKNGMAQPILSKGAATHSASILENPAIISSDLREMGYEEIISTMHTHGFFPKKEYLFWTTPFANYNYENYTFNKARYASQFINRKYSLDSPEVELPDVSYLVEPVEGIWLLALDANVYLPKEDGNGFGGAGIGYNRVLEHKKHLVDWVSHTIQEAAKHKKILVTFSHYPMVGFNNGASDDIKAFFGDRGLQSHRVPKETVAKLFADLGLKIHFGGHMHLNDTGVYHTRQGKMLVNVQVPSLAAYPPAFKILTIYDKDIMEVETVVVDSVQGYDSFFEQYGKEHGLMAKNALKNPWNKDILDSENYLDYTRNHLVSLVKLRFLPYEWPKEPKKILTSLNGLQLFGLSHITKEFTQENLDMLIQGNESDPKWKKAMDEASQQLVRSGFDSRDFEHWKGDDLIMAFHKLRSADILALDEIGQKRLDQYLLLTSSFLENKDNELLSPLRLFASIFEKQLNSEPAVNFQIDFSKDKIVPLD